MNRCPDCKKDVPRENGIIHYNVITEENEWFCSNTCILNHAQKTLHEVTNLMKTVFKKIDKKF